MDDLRPITCPKPRALDVLFSILTTTAGWIYSWSTAVHATSSLRAAAVQWALPKQPRWNLHRRDHQAGVANTGYGMGVAAGDYNRDGYPDLFVTAITGPPFIATMATEHLPTSRLNLASPLQDGPPAPSGSTTTMTVASIYSSADSSNSTSRPTGSAVMRAQGNVTIVFPALSSHPQLVVSQQWRRHVYRCFRSNRDQLRAG